MAKVNKEVTETPKKRGRPAKKPELKDNEANSKAEELLTVTGAEAEAEVKAEEPVKKPVKPRVSRVKPPELFCIRESRFIPASNAVFTSPRPAYFASACMAMAVASGSAESPLRAQPPSLSCLSRI